MAERAKKFRRAVVALAGHHLQALGLGLRLEEAGPALPVGVVKADVGHGLDPPGHHVRHDGPGHELLRQRTGGRSGSTVR